MAEAKKQEAAYVPRLRKDYDDRIVKAMTEKFGYKNAMQVPKLDKIVINMGVGEATQENPQGGLERREAPMHVSKVAIVDPKDGKATRVRFETSKDGKKVRVAARSGEKIDG